MNQKRFVELKLNLVAAYVFGLVVFLLCLAAGYKFWLSNRDIPFDEYNVEQVISADELTNEHSYNAAVEEEILAANSLNPEFIINEGDTLSSILDEANINSNEAASIISAFAKKYNPKKLNIGTVIELHLNKSIESNAPTLESMIVNINSLKKISVALNAQKEFIATEITVPVVEQIVHQQGTIKNSFINTAMELSIPANAITSMIRAFSYDIDFQRDIKREIN